MQPEVNEAGVEGKEGVGAEAKRRHHVWMIHRSRSRGERTSSRLTQRWRWTGK